MVVSYTHEKVVHRDMVKRLLAICTLIFAFTLSVSAQTATINPSSTDQVIDGFGAYSIGGDGILTTAQADTIFSTTSGAGFSLLRTPIPDDGSCTSVSASCAGDSSTIANEQLAIARGAKVWSAPWSPPASMKTNGSTICNTGSGPGSLISSDYGSYAAYLSNYIASLSSFDGISLYAISVQNEPDYCPTTSDGASWTAANIDNFTKTNLGPTLASAGQSSVLIVLPESSHCGSYLSSMSDTTFGDSSATAYPLVAACHDYGIPTSTINLSQSAYSTAQSIGKHYWETEVALLRTTWDPSVTDALQWAHQIHNWMTVAGANAWNWWTILGGAAGDNEKLIDSSRTVAKRVYAIGNFARFVRPGYYRIDATANPQSGIYVSAYKNPAASELIIVAINTNSSGTSQTFSLSGTATYFTTTPYLTDVSNNLVAQTPVLLSGNSFTTTLGAQSVTTFVISSDAVVTPSTTYQVIQGFGATDQAAMFGPSPASMTSTQADTFFSTTSGAGLSILRTGVSTGAGGYKGGSCTTVSSGCIPTYTLSDMQLAIARGAHIFATPWTPPAVYKTNGSTICNTSSGNASLITSDYAAYATWLSNWVQTLTSLYSIPVYALSVQNEPDYCPTTYEGAVWSGANIRDFIKNNLGPTMASAGSLSTLIVEPETSNVGDLTSYGSPTFADTAAAGYTGIAGTHNYEFTTPAPYPAAQNLGKQYWETEVAHLSATWDGSMTDALYWANQIYEWLDYANANAWLYWSLLDPESSEENGGLMRQDGVTTSKRLWVMGNWSRWVRPGYYRIDITANPQAGIYLTAFKDPSTSQIVIVATNSNSSSTSQGFSISSTTNYSTTTPYLTDASNDLAAQMPISLTGNSFSAKLAADSVTTFPITPGGTSSTVRTPDRVEPTEKHGRGERPMKRDEICICGHPQSAHRTYGVPPRSPIQTPAKPAGLVPV
jgi:glucuronoarabinoxylan endo-1,4-beta-xylanase